MRTDIGRFFKGVRELGQTWSRGIVVYEDPDVRRVTLRVRSGGHGHTIFYRVGDLIYVLRILHSSQDWESMIDRDEI